MAEGAVRWDAVNGQRGNDCRRCPWALSGAAGRKRPFAAAPRNKSACALGPRVSPRAQAFANDRRSGGQRDDCLGARGRGGAVPPSRADLIGDRNLYFAYLRVI